MHLIPGPQLQPPQERCIRAYLLMRPSFGGELSSWRSVAAASASDARSRDLSAARTSGRLLRRRRCVTRRMHWSAAVAYSHRSTSSVS